MHRRQFNGVSLGLMAVLASPWASALTLADLTNADAAKGIKLALEKGAVTAVQLLGVQDGFFGNPGVRIALPGFLEDASRLLRTLGQGGRVDELLLAMNRAAEAAVPLAKDLLVGAAKSITVTDAKKILSGGESAVTNFFADKTRTPLGIKFLPVVSRATERVGLVANYNQFATKAADMGLLKREDATIQQYVTSKSLDGLYFMIAQEEKKIRQDPIGTGNTLLKKVFGALL